MDYEKLKKDVEEWMNRPPNPHVRYGTNMKKEKQTFIIAGVLALLIFLIFAVILFLIPAYIEWKWENIAPFCPKC